MRILAIIPARGGSKGIKRKNLLPIGGVPLVRRAIDSARASVLLTDYVVSTDDAEIMRAARGTLIVVRPPELASDTAGMVPVLQHAVRSLGGPPPDLVVCLQPTSPFRTGKDIDACIRKVLDTGADSAQTVTAAPYHPYFMSTLDGDRIVPLFPHDHIVRRQDAPPVYQPTGAVYVTRYRTLMVDGRVRGEDNRAVVTDFTASVNIDTIWDYRLAESVEKETGC